MSQKGALKTLTPRPFPFRPWFLARLVTWRPITTVPSEACGESPPFLGPSLKARETKRRWPGDSPVWLDPGAASALKFYRIEIK
jgi:hypothetical protein